MAMPGSYKCELPRPAIDFTSPKGKKLFTEALQDGTMEGFFKLISNFQTQCEPAYCGLASLAMVLNALAIDPCRTWKGQWRWFDENMLDCCEPLERVKVKGIPFGKSVSLAHCAGANVEAFRTDQSSINEFRKYVIECSRSEDCHVISSYSRKVLKQAGSGHFSPIGGYYSKRDMVLILDVARFKYPPHWVRLSLLWKAMNIVDKATGLRRGFMLVSRQKSAPAYLYTLSCRDESWIRTVNYLKDDAPVLLSSDNVKDISDVISTILSSLPPDFAEFIKCVAELHEKEDGGKALEVLKLLRESGLYKHVTDTLSSKNYICSTVETLDHRDCLLNAAASACCQEPGKSCLSCTAGEKNVTVVSGTATNIIEQQGVHMVASSSQREASSYTSDSCLNSSMYPASNDILTALLLALSPETWSAIKDEQLLMELSGLVSIDNLPSLLQHEILHLRGQLRLLETYKDDTVRDM